MNKFKNSLSVIFTAFLATYALATTDQYIRLGGGGSASGAAIGDVITGGTQGSVLFLGSGGKLAQDNTELFWDDTNFRLGIGSATPARALDVVGQGKISTGLITPLIFPAANSTSAVQVDKADGTTVVLNVDTTNARLGIGSATPAYQLTIDGGALDAATGNAAINIVTTSATFGPEIRMNSVSSGHSWIMISGSGSDTVGNGNFAIQDGGSIREMIDTSGNVGIGTVTPGSKVEVNGGVRLFTATSRPSCAVGIRGTWWVVSSGAGVTDTAAVCLKSTADTYSWVQIVTGG